MIVISWDVGIIHLAYCILNYQEANVEILDWDVINLIEDERIKMECCGKMKAKKDEAPEICGKNATYVLNTPDKKSYGFCKTHLSQSNNYWSEADTKKMYQQIVSESKSESE